MWGASWSRSTKGEQALDSDVSSVSLIQRPGSCSTYPSAAGFLTHKQRKGHKVEGSLGVAAMLRPLGWALLLACMLGGLCSQTARALDDAASHKRWIIITSISYPTDAIKVLAKMPDWKVLVVADEKTPADWALENVEFLGMEEQRKLGYEILPLTPLHSYARKNLGYLWAIQHGAEELYETDDDNEPVNNMLPNLDNGYYVYNGTGRQVANPYAHFGFPHIWPRGYPLDQIRPQAQAERFSRLQARPLILQGLADKDPDVDAIFRLTQPMGIDFDKESPAVVLPEGLMCPFNSQNTLFDQKALWGTLIPITTSFRVCDIWRGYWVQRLLWELEGNLAFTAPTVDQFRNPHTLTKDFLDEDDLYKKAGSIVDFLIAWRPSAGASLPAMMVELAQAMADNKFWEVGDVALMQAWVKDLEAIGYSFPTPRRHRQPASIAPLDVARPTPKHWYRYHDIVLVVVYDKRFNGWLEVHERLKKAYTPLFRQIVYTGFMLQPEFPEEDTWISCQAGRGAEFQYACFGNVMQEIEAPPSGGYLFIQDDAPFSHCMIPRFNKSQVWYDRHSEVDHSDLEKEVQAAADKGEFYGNWHISGMQHVNRYLQKLMADGGQMGGRMRHKLKGDLQSNNFGSGKHADVFYVPVSARLDFALAAAALAKSGLHNEIIMSVLLGMITDVDGKVDIMPVYRVGWDFSMLAPDDALADKLLPSGVANGAFAIHPIELSRQAVYQQFWRWWTEEYSC
ncbi:g4491 [Coccomyxa viridis]|uniref:G4491 protein n=1 Tax=Coccomyxa viridis TaxID=1274662 RepID=A0ABP1FQG1_9CHLO